MGRLVCLEMRGLREGLGWGFAQRAYIQGCLLLKMGVLRWVVGVVLRRVGLGWVLLA